MKTCSSYSPVCVIIDRPLLLIYKGLWILTVGVLLTDGAIPPVNEELRLLGLAQLASPFDGVSLPFEVLGGARRAAPPDVPPTFRIGYNVVRISAHTEIIA